MQDQPFILGVNYWPRRKAMYWWSQFEAGEVREEFEIVAIQRFAATSPRVRPPQRTVTLDVPPEVYYQAPLDHARRLYQKLLGASHPGRT